MTSRLLITFANGCEWLGPRPNGLDPPELDQNSLTRIVFLKEFLGKQSADDNKNLQNYPACKELTLKVPITTAADDKF